MTNRMDTSGSSTVHQKLEGGEIKKVLSPSAFRRGAAKYQTLQQSGYANRTSSSFQLDEEDGFRKTASYRISPPRRSSSCAGNKSFDANLFNFLKVLPDDFAAEITLVDAAVFKDIKEEELLSRAWNNPKEKMKVAPNIVAFTKRFNLINFWVQRLIVEQNCAKVRAEYIVHFLKIAKKLHELNNLHGEYAVVSALNTAAIGRLEKTWQLVSKKELANKEKFLEIFKGDDNHKVMRDHLNTASLPCVPHLGIYLKDLIYIDTVSPRPNSGKQQQERAILQAVASFQQSRYDHLKGAEHVRSYLESVNYIEELQKFVEDDLFKASLKLEPLKGDGNSPRSTTSKHRCSKDDLSIPSSMSSSFAQKAANFSPALKHKFIPCHRKTKSLGTNVFTSVDGGLTKCYSIVSSGEPAAAVQLTAARYLIDDSCVHDSSPASSAAGSTSKLSDTAKFGSQSSGLENTYDSPVVDVENKTFGSDDEEVLQTDFEESKICIQGCLRRKTMQKQGKKPAVLSWSKFWAILSSDSDLFLYSTKSLHLNLHSSRKDFRSWCNKKFCVTGWLVGDCQQSDCSFTLSHPTNGNLYKFKANSCLESAEWVRHLQLATKRQSQDLITLF